MTVEAPHRYRRDKYPETFKRYGDRYMKKRANPFVDQVRTRVAMMNGGDRCEYVELSHRSTAHRVICFADFSDGVRMWVADDDIERPVWDRWKDRHLLTGNDHQAIEEFFKRAA